MMISDESRAIDQLHTLFPGPVYVELTQACDIQEADALARECARRLSGATRFISVNEVLLDVRKGLEAIDAGTSEFTRVYLRLKPNVDTKQTMIALRQARRHDQWPTVAGEGGGTIVGSQEMDLVLSLLPGGRYEHLIQADDALETQEALLCASIEIACRRAALVYPDEPIELTVIALPCSGSDVEQHQCLVTQNFLSEELAAAIAKEAPWAGSFYAGIRVGGRDGAGPFSEKAHISLMFGHRPFSCLHPRYSTGVQRLCSLSIEAFAHYWTRLRSIAQREERAQVDADVNTRQRPRMGA